MENVNDREYDDVYMLNLPTILTLLRIAFIPLVVLVYYLPFHGAHMVAAIIFALAAATDWLDGYLARSWNQTTRFGSFLDPVADKLIVSTMLVLLVAEHHVPFLELPAVIIIGREIAISALREWMSSVGSRLSVNVNMLAKVKTAIQLTALVLLIFYTNGMPLGRIVLTCGIILLYFAAVLTIWSMCLYLKAAWQDLTNRREPQ